MVVFLPANLTNCDMIDGMVMGMVMGDGLPASLAGNDGNGDDDVDMSWITLIYT